MRMLCLKLTGVIAGCKSQQEDHAVNTSCRPFEKSGETSVPALSRMSSTGKHERSIGAGCRRESPAPAKA
jgi:hypothetical protein